MTERQSWAVTKRQLLVMTAGTMLASISACDTGVKAVYRFRMVVNVDTPNGVRQGSSVFEVRAGHKLRLTSEEGSRYLELTGEAVAVQIAPGKNLFALTAMQSDQGNIAIMSMIALDPAFRNDMPECAERISDNHGARVPVIVPLADYPMLVSFHDLSRPETLIDVNPGDLEAAFGPGVRLHSIEVKITDDPVTTGLTARLPWLDHLNDFRQQPSNPFTNRLPGKVGYFRSV